MPKEDHQSLNFRILSMSIRHEIGDSISDLMFPYFTELSLMNQITYKVVLALDKEFYEGSNGAIHLHKGKRRNFLWI